ncbi:MAG: sugar transferase [Paracoccaceae bacterium]
MSYTFLDDIVPDAKSRRASSRIYRGWGKRVFDIITVLLIAPIVLPVLFLAWLATTFSGGKALFIQSRIGKDEGTFNCLKIRTMIPNAEQVLQDLIENDADVAEEWEKHQKLKHDPRITPLGKFLRGSSIDELPQLWNVLIGDMSLIGPRPFMPSQKDLYDDSGTRAYYSLRPGISGPWQVECRHASTFQERVRYDEDYAQNLSLSEDLKIAMRTIQVVLKHTGS